jgi:hypothetical protein
LRSSRFRETFWQYGAANCKKLILFIEYAMRKSPLHILGGKGKSHQMGCSINCSGFLNSQMFQKGKSGGLRQ